MRPVMLDERTKLAVSLPAPRHVNPEFCRVAPRVLLCERAILFAGVFGRAWNFSSRTSSPVHSRRFAFFFAMAPLPPWINPRGRSAVRARSWAQPLLQLRPAPPARDVRCSSTGLVSNSSQPAASAFSLSPAMAFAVRAITGIRLVAGSALTRLPLRHGCRQREVQ
jgi:hypothetical protein